MGHLAERYGDAARSGLYRVRDARIPRTAAREAGALLLDVDAARLAADWPRVEQALRAATAHARVLVVDGAAALARDEYHRVLDPLIAAAHAAREAGRPLFAVMVDPDGVLELPPLYREKP